MTRTTIIRFFFFACSLFGSYSGSAQLQITEETSAQALAQELVGQGIIISNATLTKSSPIVPYGLFKNFGGTNIGIDSGILLTSGRARSDRRSGIYGINGDGLTKARLVTADNNLDLPGDASLANQLGLPVGQLHDAIALEFDFIPLGDSIKFNYVFSSEEYNPLYVCDFNDAFAFFISGPGIIGEQNIALIPGTSIPVTIKNVNNIISAGCVNNPQYFINDTSNVQLVYNGHTTVFAARSKVQPCQTYHLKLVIADMGDHALDSGVFIEARSLSSNSVKMADFNHIDRSGNNYLAEGCATGTFTISRAKKEPTPMVVPLVYKGTAINGTDVQLLPPFITIPANDSVVSLNIIPLSDVLPEGIETLRIYAVVGCSGEFIMDSMIVQIKDMDTLVIDPVTATICRKNSVQLKALPGYDTYQWNNDHSLSDLVISDPIATPVDPITKYTCTATEGTCRHQDSVLVYWIVPDTRLFAGNDTVSVMGQPVQLHATDVNNAGIIQYTWSPSGFLDDATAASPKATLVADQRFVVSGITADGCKSIDDILVKVYKGPEIYVPSGFTPNNDGLNDRVIPLAVGIKEFRFFRVFDRWGQLIFSSNDPSKGWDGKIKATEQPAGTYVWMAEGIDDKGRIISRKGVVTLLR